MLGTVTMRLPPITSTPIVAQFKLPHLFAGRDNAEKFQTAVLIIAFRSIAKPSHHRATRPNSYCLHSPTTKENHRRSHRRKSC